MSNWLRNKGHRDDREALAVRPDIEALLPASVRRPEANRLAPLGGDMPDDSYDEDLDFLATLVEEIDRKPQAVKPPPATMFGPAVSAKRAAEHRMDDLRVFRDMKDEGRVSNRYDFNLNDVDMDDLLEELSTVRAALGRRKVA
jgi:hypothetical protein